MNAKTSHWVLVVASALSAAALAAAQTDPSLAAYAHSVAALCGAVATVLGLVSPSVLK